MADWLGSAIGGLFGLAGSALNQMMSYRDNKALQENQARLNYQYAEKNARNLPTWNRAGLESAGYNPMLAVQNSTAGSNSAWAGSASTQPVDYMAGVSHGVANAQSFQRLVNETKTAESSVKANEATARNQNALASNSEAENPYIGKKAEAEIGRMSAETSKLTRETQYFDALEENLRKRLELDRQLGFAGIDVQRAGVGAQYANARAAQTSAEAKTLSQILGKYTEKTGKVLVPKLKNFLIRKYNSRFDHGAVKL